MNLRAWLRAGIGVKRWLLVVFVGELGLALALALILRAVYRDVEVDGPLHGVVYVLTLQFLPYALRGVLLAAVGVGLFAVGSYRLVRALTDPFRPLDAAQPLVEVIYQKRFLARGPRIVAIGGGTGLSTLLRGLKEHTSNLTAVVTVADKNSLLVEVDVSESNISQVKVGQPCEIRLDAFADTFGARAYPTQVVTPGVTAGPPTHHGWHFIDDTCDPPISPRFGSPPPAASRS